MFSFNLIDEKWLPCLMRDSTVRDLSLRDILLEPGDVAELIGDSPPVTIAIHRLLLAVLHRALQGPQSYEEWESIWNAKSFDAEGKLSGYLDSWKHRFDLFDTDHPFYQSASAREKIQAGAVIQLYFQGKNNATLFDHSTTSSPRAVSPAESARLLIAFQAFDFGGIKADGSAQAAPLLQSAVALIRGNDCFQTLALNLHAYSEVNDLPFSFSFQSDLPVWERDSDTIAEKRWPDGYVDLLTWQSRRIVLGPALSENGETVVKDAVIMRGSEFPPDYRRSAQETMMAFRKSKKEGYFSVGFSENKALWRDSLSILQTAGNENSRPRSLEWINELASNGSISRDSIFPVEFYGLAADQAKLLFWRQDRFSLPIVFLHDADLISELAICLKFSEEVGSAMRYALKVLSEQLETAAGNFGALANFWSRLEIAFLDLLVAMPANQSQAVAEWFTSVDGIAHGALATTCRSFGGSAAEFHAVVKAERAFRGARTKLLNSNSEFAARLRIQQPTGGTQ